jgi:uncharacterized membrane protein YqaE (UPF0057 family)
MPKGLLVAASCVMIVVCGVWIGGIMHAFRHHGGVDRILTIVVPPWGVFRGVEGFLSHESGLLGFNLDEGNTKMRRRIQQEGEKEEALRQLLVMESDRVEYRPADNTAIMREWAQLRDAWRGKLYTFRATVTVPKDKAKVDEFLRLMDELDATFQRQKELMAQLTKKFPRRGQSS